LTGAVLLSQSGTVEAHAMKKLILICAAMASVSLAGCVYRPYPYQGSYYGNRYNGGYGDSYGDRYYSGSYGNGGYDRGYRERYRDSDRRDDRSRPGYYDRDDDR
jgi:hypothetical protein